MGLSIFALKGESSVKNASPSQGIYLKQDVPELDCGKLLAAVRGKAMKIQFREFNPFDLWIWLEFNTVPSDTEKQYVEEVFNSWFFLGKLGGFNAENLQVQDVGLEVSHMEYDDDMADESLMSLMHNMGEFQYHGTWSRCWFDLGTSDAIALDVLVNSLRQFSKEYVNFKRLIIGGVNPDWPIDEDSKPSSFAYNN